MAGKQWRKNLNKRFTSSIKGVQPGQRAKKPWGKVSRRFHMLYLAKELPAPGQGVQKEMCDFSHCILLRNLY